MEYLTHSLLSPQGSEELANKLLLNKSDWEDGKKSAGSQASKVKNNLQLDKTSKTSIKCSDYVLNALKKDHLIKSFCLPKAFHGIMFSRTNSGEGYGTHIDNAYMKSGRSDLSFTLFLSKASSYQGGALQIETMQETKEIKLDSGEIIIYPSNSLHSVEKVSNGERLVCIGWIQSHVKSNEDRNTLFGLDAGARGLLAKHGVSPELDLVFQSYNNLLRRLGD